MLKEYDIERLPYLLSYKEESAFLEVYGRQPGRVTLGGQLIEPKGVPRKTLLIFMHPLTTHLSQ